MSIRFESMETMAHRAMAHKLSGLVARQASDEAVDEFSSVTGSLGYSFGDITTLLPITRFASMYDVERIANDLELSAIAGPVHAHPEMFGIFYELGLNAVQHSQSVVGCYVIFAVWCQCQRRKRAHYWGCGLWYRNPELLTNESEPCAHHRRCRSNRTRNRTTYYGNWRRPSRHRTRPRKRNCKQLGRTMDSCVWPGFYRFHRWFDNHERNGGSWGRTRRNNRGSDFTGLID